MPFLLDSFRFAAGGGATYTLTAAPGAVTLAGGAALLKRSLRMSAAPGAITLAGAAANIAKVFPMSAAPGAITLAGGAVTFKRPLRIMVAAPGAVTLAGNAAMLAYQDPHFASVVLLCGFNGVDGATSTTDDSPTTPHSFTFVGNAQLDTAQFKFGSASLLLDGTGDYLTAPDSADWNLGAGAFTIDGFFRFAVNTTTQTLVSHWTTVSNQRSWGLQYRGADATDILQFVYSTNGSSGVGINSSAWTPTVGTWYHIRCDRSGNVFRIYVDGVMLGTATAAVTLHDSSTVLRIGGINSSGETQHFNGHMDELRVTKGVARCGSDGGFTVPPQAYPRS